MDSGDTGRFRHLPWSRHHGRCELQRNLRSRRFDRLRLKVVSRICSLQPGWFVGRCLVPASACETELWPLAVTRTKSNLAVVCMMVSLHLYGTCLSIVCSSPSDDCWFCSIHTQIWVKRGIYQTSRCLKVEKSWPWSYYFATTMMVTFSSSSMVYFSIRPWVKSLDGKDPWSFSFE